MKKEAELILTAEESYSRLWLLDLKAEIQKSIRTHLLLIFIVVSYLAACVIVARIYGVAEKVSLTLYLDNFAILLTVIAAVFIFTHTKYAAFFIRQKSSKEYFLNDLRTNYFNTEHLCNTILIVFLFSIFLSAFTSFKIILPDIHPFSWDPTFTKIDALIHGGKQPWEILQPILGHPFMTRLVSYVYILWFFVMYGVVFWQAFTLRDRFLRMQFFLSYALSWILLGTITAIIFSSAGPCFYERIAGDSSVFLPLRQYLESARQSCPILALNAQDMLWQAYNSREMGQVKGISAMPSMHVSIAFLFVLVGWRTHRISGIAFTIFGLVVMLGCIHLGWHYAIDGYTSIIFTWLIWWGVSLILKRYGPSFGLETCEE